jgi:hypothetical protein
VTHHAPHIDPQDWSPGRQALLEALEAGPLRQLLPLAAHCRDVGWIDWVRDEHGRVIYGDRRCQLTARGRAQLEVWRREGKQGLNPNLKA